MVFAETLRSLVGRLWRKSSPVDYQPIDCQPGNRKPSNDPACVCGYLLPLLLSRLTRRVVTWAYSSFDIGLDLETVRHCLVMLHVHSTSFDAALDLQPTRHILVLLHAHPASLDIGLNL